MLKDTVVRYHQRYRKYQWLVLDVDGTLLDSQHVLRPRVAGAVVAAASAGLWVTLATGKLLRSIRPLLEQMKITGPQIVLNGAEQLCFHARTFEVLGSERLPLAGDEDL